jgi:PAS domain S-box-containing protein
MDAEQALRESEALFRTVFEDARVGMALFSPATGRFMRVNRAFCEMLGYSRAELEEKTVAEITHPADQHISPSEIQQVLAGEKDSFSVEKRYLHRNGTTVWILGNTSLIRSDDGEPRYFVAQIQNISARKRAEEALEQISHQRDLILNAAAEGIYGVDMDGFTTFANEAAARFLGYAVNELVGVQMHRILHHQDAQGAPLSWEDSPISACMEEQRSHHAEGEVFWTRAGAALRVHYVASPIIENGRSTGAVVVFSPMDEWREGAARASGGGR